MATPTAFEEAKVEGHIIKIHLAFLEAQLRSNSTNTLLEHEVDIYLIKTTENQAAIEPN